MNQHEPPLPSTGTDNLWDDLDHRNLISACSDPEGLRHRLEQSPTGFYVGFDPTASSLHVGSLLPVAVARRVLTHRHRVVLVVGGATGMIGDPTGRSQGRVMLEQQVLDDNLAALSTQLTHLVGENATILDNRSWLGELSALSLLSDVGKHFPINTMLARESVKTRRESGLSFTELSYQLLQAYDFWWLHTHHGIEVQIGGSDQWGNITAGIDFMRRKDNSTGWGLVWPLLTKSDGTKFGKTADGNIWLDAHLTSPFKFWQYWFNTDDTDTEQTLLQLSHLDTDQITSLTAQHRANPAERRAQRTLANELTAWVHNPSLATSAETAARALFGDQPLDTDALDLLETELDCLRLPRNDLIGTPIASLAMRGGLCTSLSEARRLAASGGLHLGKTPVEPDRTLHTEDLHQPGWALIRKGPKTWLLIRAIN